MRRAGTWMLLVALAACGRVGFDEDGSASLGAFGLPVMLAGFESVAGDDPTLTGDMLEMIYEGSGMDLWVTRRSSTNEAWGAPTRITELNTAEAEGTPEMTHDGLTLLFSRGLDTARRVLYSERAIRTDPWGLPISLPTALDVMTAVTPSADGSRWVFATNGNPYVGEWDRITWSPFRRAIEIEFEPIVTSGFLATATELWFCAGPTSLELGIFRAVRPDPGSPFETAERVPELDLAQDDIDPWLSPDLRTIVFVSRIGNSPRFFQATR